MFDIRKSINITRLTQPIIFFLILQILLTQCTRPRFVPDGYVIITARDFAVVQYTPEHPKGKIIYELDGAGNFMITAVAYDPEKKLVAIAEQNKTPQRGTAVIKIFNEKASSVVNKFSTKKDRIYGMSIDKDGRIAFAAGDMHFDRPGELCYLSQDVGIVHTIAKGKYFRGPAWSKDSKRVYFIFRNKERASGCIGYIELATPNVVRQIAEGRSVSISESGEIAYLTNNGDIILMQKTNDIPIAAKRLLRHVNPKFTDGIRFVQKTEDIVLQHYKKSVLFDLILLKSPYKEEKLMLPYVGMKDFDAAYIKK